MHKNKSGSNGEAVLENKEDRIKSFISQCLAAQRHETDDDGALGQILLITRSSNSPVARALAELATACRSEYSVRVIFVGATAESLLSSHEHDISLFADGAGFIDQPRFLDVHEQLVLGENAVWYGESMRREPNRRDAFEAFYEDCPQTAQSAIRGFNNLWQRCSRIAFDQTKLLRDDGTHLVSVNATLDQAHHGSKTRSVNSNSH